MDTTGAPFSLNTHPTLQSAFDELSQEAFAAWIRMMASDSAEFVGRARVAKMLNLSQGRSDVIIRELKHKGYVTVTPGEALGTPSTIRVVRRCIISGRNQFIRLSSVTTMAGLNLARRIENAKPQLLGVCFVEVSGDKEFLDEIQKWAKDHNDLDLLKRINAHKKRFATNPTQSTPSTPTLKSAHDNRAYVVKEQPVSRIINQQYVNSSQNHSVLRLDRVREKIEQDKKERSEKAKQGAEKRKQGATEGCSSGVASQSIVNELNSIQPNYQNIKFIPGPKLRSQYIDILRRRPTDPVRRELVNRLGVEFRRIYSRYRHLVDASYVALDMEREDQSARNAAIQCITKNVTPTALIAYWHEHVGDFTDMKFPPLSFLSSPGNVDKVACVAAPGTQKKKPIVTADSSHSYSNPGMLDPRLRPGLLAAGFPMDKWNDRELLTIQGAAKTIAQGVNMFVGERMRSMVDWAAANLYGGGDNANSR